MAEGDVSEPSRYYTVGGVALVLVAMLWLASRRWGAMIVGLTALAIAAALGVALAGWRADRRINRFGEERDELQSFLADWKTREPSAYETHVMEEKFMREWRLKDFLVWEARRNGDGRN